LLSKIRFRSGNDSLLERTVHKRALASFKPTLLDAYRGFEAYAQ